jgi:hypothetical protein
MASSGKTGQHRRPLLQQFPVRPFFARALAAGLIWVKRGHSIAETTVRHYWKFRVPSKQAT